jgi:hypothetical protein
MNLSMGNKNVVLGLIVIMLYLSMTFFIERTNSLPGFHSKAAAAVVDTKNSSNLLEHQVVDAKKGPAYRTGGMYFTNYYPASYIPVPNSYKDTAYNMRFYAWMAALFGIVVGVIVGLQTQAGLALRTWASWLAVIGVILFPIRDTVGFWGRWLEPTYGFGALGPIVYPIKWIGGAAVFLSLLLALIVFVQGAQRAAAK